MNNNIDLYDIHNIILNFYIKNITYYPNINNILLLRLINNNFKKKINYAILNYQELIFKLPDNEYLIFFKKYVNIYILLCINDNKYNAYESKMMIYNLLYVIKTRYSIFSKLESENYNYKLIIFNNINFNLIYNINKNIKYYYKDIDNFKKNIKYALNIK